MRMGTVMRKDIRKRRGGKGSGELNFSLSDE